MSTQSTDGQQPSAPSIASSKAWMLGPKAENQDIFERLFLYGL